MAPVLFDDGTSVNTTLTSERTIKIWTSPATMDSADTVVLPTVTGKTLRILSAFDNTTGDAVTASVSSFTVTVDAAGATTDHTYTLQYMYE
jgi:hypothetical protein